MNVGICRPWYLEMNDMIDGWDIETTSRDVGGEEQLHDALYEWRPAA